MHSCSKAGAMGVENSGPGGSILEVQSEKVANFYEMILGLQCFGLGIRL
jgi:hypothetical protein